MEKEWKIQRGDIYFTRFDYSIGSEQRGNRPAIVIQNDTGNHFSPTVIVAVLTSKIKKKSGMATHCLLENDFLKVPSTVHTEQIFTVDKSRLIHFMGHVSPEEMERVDDALKNSLSLNPGDELIRKEPVRRSRSAYAPPQSMEGRVPVYPCTKIESSFEGQGTVEEMILYMELQNAIQAMIQRLEYSFTFHPSLLKSPKRKRQVRKILQTAEQYLWKIKEETR